MIKQVTSNMAKFQAEIKAWEKLQFKSAVSAAKIEGYRLRKVLREQLEKGAPGGISLKPLTELAKRFRGEKLIKGGSWAFLFPPLYRLKMAVRYRAEVQQATGKATVLVGFVGKNSKDVSRTWQRIVEKHQKGFGTSMEAHTSWGEPLRTFLSRLGSGSTSWSPGKYVPKKSTTRLQTPARPIIDPFWASQKGQTDRNIVNNWEKKMRGERI